jgi:hypothetical protein
LGELIIAAILRHEGTKKIITGIMRNLPGVLAAKQVMEKDSTFNIIMG